MESVSHKRALNEFISHCTAPTNSTRIKELSVQLFIHVPVSRQAVLQHAHNIYTMGARLYVESRKKGRKARSEKIEEELIEVADKVSYLQAAFTHVATQSVQSWASTIAEWAVNLLAKISVTSQLGEGMEKGGVGPMELETSLELWMECSSTRSLLDITTHCFQLMIEAGCGVNRCVESLIRLSSSHSPHFDWALAHLSSCFPVTMIERVLQVGLHDYSATAMNQAQQQKQLMSAAHILSHLNRSHPAQLSHSITQFFMNGIRETDRPLVSVCPYMLQLASQSPPLLTLITNQLLPLARDEGSLHLISHQILSSRFSVRHNPQSLVTPLVYVISKSQSCPMDILRVLLKTTPEGCDETSVAVEMAIKAARQHILTELIGSMQREVFASLSARENPSIPFLTSLSRDREELLRLVAVREDVVRLLLLVGLSGGQNLCASILLDVLCDSAGEGQQSDDLFMQLYVQMIPKMPSLPPALITLLSNRLKPLKHCNKLPPVHSNESVPPSARAGGLSLLANLQKVLSHQHSPHSAVLSSTLLNHLPSIFSYVTSTNLELPLLAVFHVTLNLKALSKLPRADIWSLAVHLVRAFFNNQAEGNQREMKEGWRYLYSLIPGICQLPGCLPLVLRQLLEGAVSQKYTCLYGGPADRKQLTLSSVEEEKSKGTAGKISMLLRPHEEREAILAETGPTRTPTSCLCTLLRRCRSAANGREGSSGGVDLGGCAAGGDIPVTVFEDCLSTLLLHFLLPDVIPFDQMWPDISQISQTIERDLYVKRQFDLQPVIVDLLTLVVSHSSSFLRLHPVWSSLLAVLHRAWSSARVSLCSEMSSTYQLTSLFYHLTQQADVLPQTLSHISLLFPYLEPHDMARVTAITWNNLRAAVQGGLMVTDLDAADLETIRCIIQSHIEYTDAAAQLLKFLDSPVPPSPL